MMLCSKIEFFPTVQFPETSMNFGISPTVFFIVTVESISGLVLKQLLIKFRRTIKY